MKLLALILFAVAAGLFLIEALLGLRVRGDRPVNLVALGLGLLAAGLALDDVSS